MYKTHTHTAAILLYIDHNVLGNSSTRLLCLHQVHRRPGKEPIDAMSMGRENYKLKNGDEETVKQCPTLFTGHALDKSMEELKVLQE